MKTLIAVSCVLLVLATTSIQAANLDNTLLARYLCRTKQNGFRSLVPGSCSQYYECQNGKSELHSCPRYYDSINSICVNTNTGCVETLRHEISDPVSECTGPCRGVSNGYVVEPTNSRVYYQCKNNCAVTRQTCAGDLMFDVVQEVCASASTCEPNRPCTSTTTPCTTTTRCVTTPCTTRNPCTTTSCTSSTPCSITTCTTIPKEPITPCTTTPFTTTTTCTTTSCTTTTRYITTPGTTTTPCATTTSCTTTTASSTTTTSTTTPKEPITRWTTTPCTTTTTCTTTSCTTTTPCTPTAKETKTPCITTTASITKPCSITTTCSTTPKETAPCTTAPNEITTPCTTTKKPCTTIATSCATTTKASCVCSNNATVASTAVPVNNIAYTMPLENSQSNIDIYMRFVCRDKPDGFMLASLKSCSEYFICRYGHALSVSCGNKHFNALKGYCDLPENTKCIQNQVFSKHQ